MSNFETAMTNADIFKLVDSPWSEWGFIAIENVINFRFPINKNNETNETSSIKNRIYGGENAWKLPECLLSKQTSNILIL